MGQKVRDVEQTEKEFKQQRLILQPIISPKENFKKMDLTQPKSEKKNKIGRLKLNPRDKSIFKGGNATRDIRNYFEQKKFENIKKEGGGGDNTISGPAVDLRRISDNYNDFEKVGRNEPLRKLNRN